MSSSGSVCLAQSTGQISLDTLKRAFPNQSVPESVATTKMKCLPSRFALVCASSTHCLIVERVAPCVRSGRGDWNGRGPLLRTSLSIIRIKPTEREESEFS